MADDQQFCLRWNNFQTNFTSQFEALRVEEDFVDVTLACEGKRIKAHKLVLSACSPYFKELFKIPRDFDWILNSIRLRNVQDIYYFEDTDLERNKGLPILKNKGNPCKHPIIFMQDVEYEHLLSLVEFMYAGEVNISQTKLPTFLHTAESLQIRGLTAAPQNKLPQNTDRNVSGLRPAPTLSRDEKPSLNRSSSPESNQTDDSSREDGGHSASKRLCFPPEQPHHTRESTSFSEMSTAVIETKMEPMDYYSDGEVKHSSFHNPGSTESTAELQRGYSLQGALDAAASMSAQISQLGETSQESVQEMVGEMCKPHSLDPAMWELNKPHSLDPRPCPECGRVYSNISNLRQHIRLIHYPECITCPLCFKPFKNKLYLKRHIVSYHEITVPSQNEYKYQCNVPPNFNAPIFTSKSEAPEGFNENFKQKSTVYNRPVSTEAHVPTSS